MFTGEQYELLDFGNGEKLERFGDTIVRRQTPSVPIENGFPDSLKSTRQDWHSQLRYSAGGKNGNWWGDKPIDWRIQHGVTTFLLKTTPAGQLGMFPEQASNWDWISDLPFQLGGLKALNLFGYTGGTTLALAARGASVVHVDAASSAVKWARENAAASGMKNFPIRWIVEDALKFIQREFKRGSKYDILVADPPSYGKGPKKEAWKFAEQIDLLLAGMAAIASLSLNAIILSCHTPGYDHRDLNSLVKRHWRAKVGNVEAIPLELKTVTGRVLPSGHCCRWFRPSS